jgi:ubiquinone/menaquinone biosynthesis C-methylase UbiE
MTGTRTPTGLVHHAGSSSRAYEILTAVSMTVGRGPTARAVAGTAGLTAGDRVLDIGCGPGTAVREAARRGATATGLDPSPVMLRLARRTSALRRIYGLAWLQGRAEALPLPDRSVTLAWALSSAHHWDDRRAAFGEVRRVLAPGGRVLLAERLTRPGARGHAAHGLTPAQAGELAQELTAAGFTDVRVQTRRARRRALIIVQGRQRPQG